MTNRYLQVTPIPGKWYVSERSQGTRHRIVDAEHAAPPANRLSSEMILAGPFDTRALAQAWNTQKKASGYIWEGVAQSGTATESKPATETEG